MTETRRTGTVNKIKGHTNQLRRPLEKTKYPANCFLIFLQIGIFHLEKAFHEG